MLLDCFMRNRASVLAIVMLAVLSPAALCAPQVIYDDAMENGWFCYRNATLDFAQTAIVHSGAKALGVTIAANTHGALDLGHESFDASRYSSLTFWINGGPIGGQGTLVVKARVSDKPVGSVRIPAPAPNTWTQVVAPFTDLGIADVENVGGFMLMNDSDSALPTFLVDDIALTPAPRKPHPAATGPFVPTGHPLEFTGTNLSGGEFAHPKQGVPQIYGKNFIYPSQKEYDYFAAKGMNVIRLPFRWEILQPVLNQPLDAAELDRLKHNVDMATTKGLSVLLDPHDFSNYFGKKIGGPDVSDASFADFWARLAPVFADNKLVWFGLMNEPNGMSAEQWFGAADAAVAAIRAAGAKNLILVPGVGYSGAHSWLALGNDILLKIHDPDNNWMFEAHQYLDADNTGTHTDSVSATVGSERLKTFTQWCRKNHQRAFLGEFGAASGKLNGEAIDNMLTYMEANRDVWYGFTWYSAGPWWGNYMYSIEPTKDGEDQPQLDFLTPHLHGLAGSPTP